MTTKKGPGNRPLSIAGELDTGCRDHCPCVARTWGSIIDTHRAHLAEYRGLLREAKQVLEEYDCGDECERCLPARDLAYRLGLIG